VLARPVTRPRPERRAALVRELRVAVSAAEYGRRRVGSARDQSERFVLVPAEDMFRLGDPRGQPPHGRNVRAV
jgi:hypothetical protein